MPDLSELLDQGQGEAIAENAYQFAFLDIAFQLLDIFLNLILMFTTNILSGLFGGILG